MTKMIHSPITNSCSL